MTGFNIPNLNDAEIGEEINPLAYNPADYASIDDVVSRIIASDDRIEIKCEDLSVNGTVIQDEMNTYLSTKAVSNSALKEALKTPQHYYFYMNEPKPKKKEDHFDLGTHMHMALLEPDLFKKLVVEPKANMTTHEGMKTLIDFWEAREQTNILMRNEAKDFVIQESLDMEKLPGKKAYYEKLKSLSRKQSVDEEHYNIIRWVSGRFDQYGGGILRKLFKGALTEVSMYGTDPETGIKVKIRPDAIQLEENIGANTIISVKTTKANTKGKFELDCASYGYHVGEGMYQKVASDITGRKFNCTIMVMLQTVPPYLPAVFFWHPEDLEAGKYQYQQGMLAIEKCMETGLYPGFDAYSEAGHYGIIPMALPTWIQKEIDPIDVEF